MSNAYDTANASMQRIRSAATSAMQNDVMENLLVLTRLQNLAQAVVQPWLAASVAYEAKQLWGSITSNLSSIQSHHDWLSASRRSPQLLQQAAIQWQSVSTQQGQVVDAVRTNRNRVEQSQWDGQSQEGHLAHVSKKEQSELAFAESVARIVEGCELAGDITEGLLMRAIGMCAQAEMSCASARAAATASSPFARNWRMRRVNNALATLASQYQRVRNGDGWRNSAAHVATIFDENAQALKTLSGGRLQATAV